VLAFNPMYSIIAAYRKVLLGGVAGLEDWHIGWDWRYLAVSAALATFLFVLGLFYFRRTERRFSDIA
jgi:ABC-type polysaccharide/polyol phosphate export permease